MPSIIDNEIVLKRLFKELETKYPVHDTAGHRDNAGEADGGVVSQHDDEYDRSFPSRSNDGASSYFPSRWRMAARGCLVSMRGPEKRMTWRMRSRMAG